MVPFLLLALGMGLVLGGVIWLKLHPFLALALAAFLIAFATPQSALDDYAENHTASQVALGKMGEDEAEVFKAKFAKTTPTKRVVEENGDVAGLECVRIEWVDGKIKEIEGSEFTLKADLILLAMGFTGPKRRGLLDRAGVDLDGRGNVAADTEWYLTSEANVFSCGDMRRGQSLVVWAIREGRQCAHAVDKALMGVTDLPR